MALADGVAEVLETPKLAARLSRNARAWAEKNLSMPHYLDEYKALLARLIATR
jgi:glycosyltransferase involved in cell wall biosynthesis